MRRLTHLIGALAAGAAASLASPRAEAQVFATQVRAGPGMAMSDVGEADLVRYAKLLQLDETQTLAAEALLEVYQQESREAARVLEARVEALRQEMEDTGDFSMMMEEMPKVMRKAGEEAAQREEALLNDIQTLLNGEQAQRWPKLERLRRRDKMLRFGFVSGDSVDLVRLIEALELTDAGHAAVAEPLEIYETEMDRVLQERTRQMEESQRSMESEDGGFRIDMEQVQQSMRLMRESGLKVRDVNRRHAAALEAALPEEAREGFADRLQMATFPQVYRRPHAARALDAALGFDDLTAEQRPALEDLKSRYEAELAHANERWAREIEKAEDEGVVGGMPGAGMRMMFGGPPEPEALSEARKSRRELDSRTLDALGQLLTEAQAARLPERGEETGEDGHTIIGGPGMRMRIGG